MHEIFVCWWPPTFRTYEIFIHPLTSADSLTCFELLVHFYFVRKQPSTKQTIIKCIWKILDLQWMGNYTKFYTKGRKERDLWPSSSTYCLHNTFLFSNTLLFIFAFAIMSHSCQQRKQKIVLVCRTSKAGVLPILLTGLWERSEVVESVGLPEAFCCFRRQRSFNNIWFFRSTLAFWTRSCSHRSSKSFFSCVSVCSQKTKIQRIKKKDRQLKLMSKTNNFLKISSGRKNAPRKNRCLSKEFIFTSNEEKSENKTQARWGTWRRGCQWGGITKGIFCAWRTAATKDCNSFINPSEGIARFSGEYHFISQSRWTPFSP